MVNASEKIQSCLAALNVLTVTGRQNCFIVAAVCNDLDEVLKMIQEEKDQDKRGDDVGKQTS